MKFTRSWLADHLATEATPQQLSEAMTALGLEVESVENPGAVLRPFTVAFIKDAVPHPNADKLRVCTVETGTDTRQVVCGAPNARAGIKVILADIGVTIPTNGLVIKKSKIRDVESNGMLCSARELGLGQDHDGIVELPEDARVGESIVDLMGLDDPVFDLSVTANRADCLAVRGIARDLAAKGIGTLKPLPVAPELGGETCPVSVTIKDAASCPHFIGVLIRGVKNGASPAWLQRRLEAVGLRPISALVDITNYFTLTFARPLHVYDAAKLQGGIVVRGARVGETLAALNGKEYTLEEGQLVIADASGPLGLGGVMGGSGTGVSETTTDVFLESAWFAPSSIAATGRALQIHSDARHRFERGVDPASTRDGLLRAAAMIQELCDGTPTALVEAGDAPAIGRSVAWTPEAINAYGGTSFSAETITHTLEALGFRVNATSAHPPSWRADIAETADLAEEVLRVQGYQHLPSTPLPAKSAVAQPVLTPLQKRLSSVRRTLAARGLLECYGWSFISHEIAVHFGGGAEALQLQNPISAELSDMRPSLVPQLVQAAAANARRGTPDLGLFEAGLQWHNPSPTGQTTVACALRAGEAQGKQVHGAPRAVDAYDAKADAFTILTQCGLNTANLTLQSGSAPAWYHPGRSATILLGKQIIGQFGELHPATLTTLDAEGPMVACEIFLQAVPFARAKGTARPALALSDFQATTRDFAFVMNAAQPVSELLIALRKAEKQLLQSAEVFDVYQGKGVPEGKKSVAITLTLQATDRTLTEADLTRVSAAMVTAGASVGAELRV